MRGWISHKPGQVTKLSILTHPSIIHLLFFTATVVQIDKIPSGLDSRSRCAPVNPERANGCRLLPATELLFVVVTAIFAT